MAVTFVRFVMHRAADADLEDARPFHQARFEDAADDRAVVVALFGQAFGCIGVRVEVNQREGCMMPDRRSENRKQNGVVAAEGDDGGAAVLERADRRLDPAERRVEVERTHGDVACIDGTETFVDADLHRPAVVAAEDRRLPDRAGAEPRARTESHQAVERNPGDREVDGTRSVVARKAAERLCAGVCEWAEWDGHG